MNTRIKSVLSSEHLPFLILLTIGFILRLIQLDLRPWDSDELGAIFRAQNASNFEDHLHNGVKVDGHPALVQTLLYFNFKLFRLGLTSLKLIWVIMSLCSVVFFYLFFKKRHGLNSSLFVAASLLFLWWPVSISFWVRPYTPALFFNSLFLYLWSKIDGQQGINFKNIIICGILLALSASTHYMAFLTLLVFLTTEWYFQNTSFKKLGMVCLVGGIIYLPQIGIFFHQLSLGGLGWLGKPDASFIKYHLAFTLNESNFLSAFIMLSLGGIVFWLYRSGLNDKLKNSVFQSFCIWIIFLCIVFIYSVFRQPILQNNALYFVFPYLLAASSIGLESLKKSVAITFVSVFSIVAIFSLIYEKQYLTETFKDRYAFPVKQIAQFQKSSSSEIPVYLDGPEDIFRFHLTKNPIKNIRSFDRQSSIEQLLKLNSADSVFFSYNAGSDIHLQTYVWSHFRLVSLTQIPDKRTFYPGGELYLGIKDSISYLDRLPSYQGTIKPGDFVFVDFAKISKETGHISDNDILMVSIETSDDSIQSQEYHLVTALFQEGFNKALNQIDYRYVSNTSVFNQRKSGNQKWITAPIKLADIKNWDKNSKVRISYENRDMKPSTLNENLKFRIVRIPGNPQLYGVSTKQLMNY